MTSAPTIQLDVQRDTEADLSRPPRRRRRGGMFGALAIVALLGGGAYGAWYLHGRGRSTDGSAASGDAITTTTATTTAGGPVADPVPVDGGAPTLATGAPDAAAAGALDAAAPVVVDAALAITVDAGVAAGDAGAIAVVGDAGVARDAAVTVSVDEIELAPDPATAEDLAPQSAKQKADADDEAEDAPATSDEGERRAPPPPRLAPTIHDAVVLIKQGKSERALASLHALKKKNPRSAYVPFLLGNLYFDKRWWSVALDYYRLSISKNAKYKQNPTLNNNVIRMLASSKTVGKASYFLQKTIGRPALPYLKYAAQHASSPHVRWYAGKLAARIR